MNYLHKLIIILTLLSQLLTATDTIENKLTNEEIEFIKKHPLISFRVRPNMPPFEFVQNGIVSGIAVDYIKKSAENIGLNIDFVVNNDPLGVAHNTIENQNGKYNTILFAVKNKQRAQRFSFGMKYLSYPMMIVTHKNSPNITSLKDMKNKTIVLEESFLTNKWIKRDYPSIKIVNAPNTKKALQMVNDENVIAYVGNLGVATYMKIFNGMDNLKISAHSGYGDINYSFIAPKEWPELSSLLSKGFKQISSIEHSFIQQKWFAIQTIEKTDYSLLWKIVLALSSIILLILLLNRKITIERNKTNQVLLELERTKDKEEKSKNELLKSNEKIALTSQLLNESQQIAQVGGWKLDLKTDNLFWTDETYRIHDTSAEEFNPTVDAGVDYFLPESKEIISKALDDAINKGIGYDLELETYTTKGRKIDVRTTCLVIQEEGTPIELRGIFQDISIQKENQRIVEKSNEVMIQANTQLEKAEKLANIGNWKWDIEKDNFNMSKGFCLIHGITENVLTIAQLIPIAHPEDRDSIERAFKDAINGVRPYNITHRIIRQDNKEVRIVNAKGIVTYDKDGQATEMIGSTQDITEIKNVQDLLEQKKKELETIIQEAPNPIILHNEEGEILLLNKAWTNISGYKQEEISTIEKWITTVYKDLDTQNIVRTHISGLYEIISKVNEGTFTFFTKNNKEVIWQVSSAPLGLIEGKRTIITSAMDITKLKQNEKLLFEQSKLASMGEMIGNIAHQWRQPLSVISTGATGLLVAKEFNTLTDDEFDKICNAINDNAQYLSKTIDDFRNFIKGERKKINFNLGEDVNSFLHLIEGTIKKNEIHMVKDIQEGINIVGYPNELIQCFINIFNNAKDAFTNIEIDKYIFISSYIKDDFAIITFKDNAGGIPDDVLPKIFEPYFTTKHESKGTGLGLHMTYTLIVDGMGGTIESNNTTYEYDGKGYSGAEFIISLPIS